MFRLHPHAIPSEPEPAKVLKNGPGKLRPAADVSISSMRSRNFRLFVAPAAKQPAPKRVTEMQKPGWAWGEAGHNGHGAKEAVNRLADKSSAGELANEELDGPRWGPASKATPKQLVVLCHGLGADGHDLIDLAPIWSQRRAGCGVRLGGRAVPSTIPGSAGSGGASPTARPR